MAKAPKQRETLAQFEVPVKVRIRAPEFEPLRSLSALDTKRLSRGNHSIEIGFVNGGCCRSLVRAIVKRGMVTGCEVEPCEGTSEQPVPPELREVLAMAREKVTAGREWSPIPIGELIRSQARMRDLIIITGGGCFYICIWHFCLMCCWSPRPHCFVPTISTDPL